MTSPAGFGRALAREAHPDGMPRGDVQGVIEARFGFFTDEAEAALQAYDDEFDRLGVA